MKKFISLLLSIIMVVAFAPSVFATDEVAAEQGLNADMNVEQSTQEVETDEAAGEVNDVLSDEQATDFP